MDSKHATHLKHGCAHHVLYTAQLAQAGLLPLTQAGGGKYEGLVMLGTRDVAQRFAFAVDNGVLPSAHPAPPPPLPHPYPTSTPT